MRANDVNDAAPDSLRRTQPTALKIVWQSPHADNEEAHSPSTIDDLARDTFQTLAQPRYFSSLQSWKSASSSSRSRKSPPCAEIMLHPTTNKPRKTGMRMIQIAPHLLSPATHSPPTQKEQRPGSSLRGEAFLKGGVGSSAVDSVRARRGTAPKLGSSSYSESEGDAAGQRHSVAPLRKNFARGARRVSTVSLSTGGGTPSPAGKLPLGASSGRF
ncbi:hypothetical protein T484DRAFT_1927313 [Baffinella frigidus]|nr:hypothetical protein T484DRAFT_1927313 [Cryptophyta sp. CCMP2293]